MKDAHPVAVSAATTSNTTTNGTSTPPPLPSSPSSSTGAASNGASSSSSAIMGATTNNGAPSLNGSLLSSVGSSVGPGAVGGGASASPAVGLFPVLAVPLAGVVGAGGITNGNGNPFSGAVNGGNSQPGTPAKGPLAMPTDCWYPLDEWEHEAAFDYSTVPGAFSGLEGPTDASSVVVAPLSLSTAPKEISELLKDPLSQTVSGKRGGGGPQDSSSGLKIKLPKQQQRTNGTTTVSDSSFTTPVRPRPNQENSVTVTQTSPQTSPPVKAKAGRPPKQNGVVLQPPSAPPTEGSVAGAVLLPEILKKGRKRNVSGKEKTAAAAATAASPRSRGKAATAATGSSSSVVPNGGDQSPVREPPAKRSKTESTAARQQRRSGPATVSVGTCTEPDLLGPQDPGSEITLEGVVWRESMKGILTVNVKWRGKSFIGSLLDQSQYDFFVSPSRCCDTPPSDTECSTSNNRSSTKDRGTSQKRRNGAALTDGGGSGDLRGASSSASLQAQQVQPPLRGGKTRRGANFQTPVSPACSEAGTPAKRRGRRPNNLGGPTLRGSEPKDNLSDLPSPTEESSSSKPKARGRRAASGSSTPGVEPTSPVASSPMKCHDAQCMKMFTKTTALNYHMKHEHKQLQATSSAPTTEDDRSSSDSQSATGENSPRVEGRPSVVPALPQSHLDLILSNSNNDSSAVASEETKAAARGKKHQRKQSNPVSSQQKRPTDDSKDAVVNGAAVETALSVKVDEPITAKLQQGVKILSASPVPMEKREKMAKVSNESAKESVPLHINGLAPTDPIRLGPQQQPPPPPTITTATPIRTVVAAAPKLEQTVRIAPDDRVAEADARSLSLKKAFEPANPPAWPQPQPQPPPSTSIPSSPSQLPLDLKIHSPLQPAKIHSPLLTTPSVASPAVEALRSTSAALSESVKVSPVQQYEDISDEEPDEAAPKGPLDKVVVVPAISRPPDMPAYFGFPASALGLPMVGVPFGPGVVVEPDRKIGGSPADLSKGFPGFYNAPRGGPSTEPYSPVAGVFNAALPNSPQSRPTSALDPGKTARSSPVTTPKVKKESSDKIDAVKTSSGKEPPGSSSGKATASDSKTSESPGAGNKAGKDDASKSPLEDVTGSGNRMFQSRPPAYAMPPSGFRSGGGGGPGYVSPLGFMGAGGLPPNMFTAEQQYQMALQMAYSGFPAVAAVRPGPSAGMPPGMPQMPMQMGGGGPSGAGPVDMVAVQQQQKRHAVQPSGSLPQHKIHELKEEKKSENRRPKTPPYLRDPVFGGHGPREGGFPGEF
ncbi:putative Zinc finger protein 609 [Hypsibius exemplaris]|uniref:Zinc finger protein 609 n=1 Tax=Hypsibius exemplaris TaxID=2072580 RepID=A0A1W0X4H2_HYPEX|nr:putative Zinc finger protein 609 [Hypsibius exemplaris]